MKKLSTLFIVFLNRPFLLLAVIFYLFPIDIIKAQASEDDYHRYRIGELREVHSSIARSPVSDEIVAISGNKSAPVHIYDWKNDKILHSYSAENWLAGSSVEFSPLGNYLIINQLFYADWAANKDKKATFIIINANTGEKVISIDASNEVKVSHDEQIVISMSNNDLTEHDLNTGRELRTLNLPGKGFCFDLSGEGKYLAVAHEPVEDDLKKTPRFKKDKKAMKNMLKYKHQVTIFSYPGFEKILTVDHFYDFVYELKFSDDDSQLFCLQIPHQKVQTGVGKRQSFLNIIDASTWNHLNKAFMSTAPYQPDFKLSPDDRFFGIVSQGARYPELHVYDYETRRMTDRFEFTYRLIESDEDGIIMADSRPSFVFLPDGEHILIAFGNRLFKWNYQH